MAASREPIKTGISEVPADWIKSNAKPRTPPGPKRLRRALAFAFLTVQKAQVSLDEMCSIRDVQEHLGDKPGARELDGIQGEVKSESVKFRHEARERPISL